MAFRHDELELADSAYRHGYDDLDVRELLRGRHLVISSRRGRRNGYEIFGRNLNGEYLLVAARIIESEGESVLFVFHVGAMSDAERRRYLRMTGSR